MKRAIAVSVIAALSPFAAVGVTSAYDLPACNVFLNRHYQVPVTAECEAYTLPDGTTVDGFAYQP